MDLEYDPDMNSFPSTVTSSHSYKRHRRVKTFIWIGLILFFILLCYWLFGPKKNSYTNPKNGAVPSAGGRRGADGPITITTVKATKGDIGVYLNAIGTVTPVYTASIVSQVTGVVTSVNYEEGQIVKKGDSLTDIDSRLYDATLMQAQGTLYKDENVLAQAQMDLERYRTAWARNAVSKQILDDQEKLVLQDTGTVKNDQGVVQFDQTQVDYCHIKAPISGRVGLRLIDPGNLVTAGTSGTTNPLVVITQLQPITVIFTISEDSLNSVLPQMKKNAELEVDVFDRTGQTKLASGKVLALDNQIDTTTGTVKVRSIFENEDFRLFPNQFVNTRLLVDTLKGVTLVPNATIQQNGQTSFVYVVQGDVIHLREIKAGVTDNGLTQVEGIQPGDMLADSSFDKLQNNSKISIASSKSSANSPSKSPSKKTK